VVSRARKTMRINHCYRLNKLRMSDWKRALRSALYSARENSIGGHYWHPVLRCEKHVIERPACAKIETCGHDVKDTLRNVQNIPTASLRNTTLGRTRKKSNIDKKSSFVSTNLPGSFLWCWLSILLLSTTELRSGCTFIRDCCSMSRIVCCFRSAGVGMGENMCCGSRMTSLGEGTLGLFWPPRMSILKNTKK
jgi:hypothetical protein